MQNALRKAFISDAILKYFAVQIHIRQFHFRESYNQVYIDISHVQHHVCHIIKVYLV